MITRVREAGEAVFDFIETLALCVVIAFALALGWAERAAADAGGDEPTGDLNHTTTKKGTSP